MMETGSITPLDAIREFGCLRLAARISNIKERGYTIRTVMEEGENRYGDTTRYARYYLEGCP